MSWGGELLTLFRPREKVNGVLQPLYSFLQHVDLPILLDHEIHLRFNAVEATGSGRQNEAAKEHYGR